MVVIGIDPGLTGGLAWLGSSVSAIPIPTIHKEGIRYPLLNHSTIEKWYETCACVFEEIPTIAAIEDVHSMPRDSKQGAFTFGFTTGGIVSYFCSLGLELVTVSPREWQRSLLSEDIARFKQSSPDLTSREVLKASSVEYVKREYPSLSLIPTPRSKNPHSGIADAVCIATYTRNKFVQF